VNKILFLSLFFCFKLSATTPPETALVLESTSNRGVLLKKEVVLIKDSMVVVNSEKLSPAEIITQSDNIKKISSFLASEVGNRCETGQFRHLYKKGKVLKEELGCLGSERFNDLEKSFKGLKKDQVTE
jgi:bifunctional N-acetylglucosamine-1-phosphate-uridyltransferase/glucosamine-1-phosphate-acetyltransferase GlmU-like protein